MTITSFDAVNAADASVIPDDVDLAIPGTDAVLGSG